MCGQSFFENSRTDDLPLSCCWLFFLIILVWEVFAYVEKTRLISMECCIICEIESRPRHIIHTMLASIGSAAQGREITRREAWVLSRMTYFSLGVKAICVVLRVLHRIISPLSTSSDALSTVRHITVWRRCHKSLGKGIGLTLECRALAKRVHMRLIIRCVAAVMFVDPVPKPRS